MSAAEVYTASCSSQAILLLSVFYFFHPPTQKGKGFMSDHTQLCELSPRLYSRISTVLWTCVFPRKERSVKFTRAHPAASSREQRRRSCGERGRNAAHATPDLVALHSPPSQVASVSWYDERGRHAG